MHSVGLAGYGSAGRHIHAPLIREAGLRVAAVSTRNPERVAQAREELAGADVVDDLDALLARDDLDVIVLATPSGDHADQAMACIEAGVPVVVDKPLATDAPAAAAVVAAARAAGVLLTVFQNRRYDDSVRTLEKVVSDGTLGCLLRLELRWERWRPTSLGRWREQFAAERGGGVLLDLQTHLIDQAIRIAGPVSEVYARLASHSTVAEDDALLICTHSTGVVSELSTTSLAGAPGPRIRALGERAAFVLNAFGSELDVYPDLLNEPGHCGWLYRGQEREQVPGAGGIPAQFYRDVSRALVSGERADLPVDPVDSVRVLEVIDAARVSARSGEAVHLDRAG
ncbi:MAG: Gfo/Idh/MocA family oxidoreductase [Actinomycetia bacterium]|nr:Gfo/Idh/MocA family oxidoreductase [Actinomycetes bacterium]